MTAATVDPSGLLEGAPRASVEDAWQTLNTRYAIGTGVLVAALALMWAVGLGPGAARGGGEPAAQAPGTATRAAGDTGGTTAPVARASSGDTAGASGAASSGPSAADAIGTASGTAGSTAASAPSGATSSAATGTTASGTTASTPAPASSAASTPAPSATGTSGTGAAASPAPNGASPTGSASTLPRPVPGAPVARLYFEPSQSWPSGEVGPRLAPVLARLKAEPDTKALVSGYHDRRGSAERNARLAQTRAQSVRRVLIREGIAADRIVLAKPQQMQGSGPDREARRVEVTLAR